MSAPTAKADPQGEPVALSVRATSLLSILLVTLGFLQIVGEATRISMLSDLGFLLAMAPYPNPFRVAPGYENFAASYGFQVSHPDGSTETIPVDRAALSRLRGPHLRKIVFLKAAALVSIYPRDVFFGALKYGMCRGGPMAQALGIASEVTSFVLRVQIRFPEDKEWSTDVHCAQ